MEFWGVEVKAGEPLKVTPELDRIIHLSQAALGESKKGNETVPLFLKIDDKKIVLGTLSPEKIPQLSLDLVFEREVELSHNWKGGSVYFCGYQTPLPEEEDDFSDDSDEEPFKLLNADNGSIKLQVENAKPAKGKSTDAKSDASAKPKAKPVEPSKENKAGDESDDDESDEEDDEEDSSDEEGDSDEEMSVDSEDENDSDCEDEETPKKKPGKGKKRSNDSATKTPVPAKKIKSDTPQKTDGKKGGHTATPHPAKGKAAANGSNAKAQTPKSGGQFSCKSCDRSFGSDGALQSHSKAKHGGK